MVKRTIAISYEEIDSPGSLPDHIQMLIRQSRAAEKKAFAPYSGFTVGAAAELEDGSVVTGNNQENRAFPSGLCAERVVLFFAGANYPDIPIKNLVISASYQNKEIDYPVSPCGACRQAMLESQSRQEEPITLWMAGKDKVIRIASIDDLLPFPFDFKLGSDQA